jgi:hypothetical protein
MAGLLSQRRCNLPTCTCSKCRADGMGLWCAERGAGRTLAAGCQHDAASGVLPVQGDGVGAPEVVHPSRLASCG